MIRSVEPLHRRALRRPDGVVAAAFLTFGCLWGAYELWGGDRGSPVVLALVGFASLVTLAWLVAPDLAVVGKRVLVKRRPWMQVLDASAVEGVEVRHRLDGRRRRCAVLTLTISGRGPVFIPGLQICGEDGDRENEAWLDELAESARLTLGVAEVSP